MIEFLKNIINDDSLLIATGSLALATIVFLFGIYSRIKDERNRIRPLFRVKVGLNKKETDSKYKSAMSPRYTSMSLNHDNKYCLKITNITDQLLILRHFGVSFKYEGRSFNSDLNHNKNIIVDYHEQVNIQYELLKGESLILILNYSIIDEDVFDPSLKRLKIEFFDKFFNMYTYNSRSTEAVPRLRRKSYKIKLLKSIIINSLRMLKVKYKIRKGKSAEASIGKDSETK